MIVHFRAQKRMTGEDVYGNKINVSSPIPVEDWSFHANGNRKAHSKDDPQTCHRTNRKAKDDNTLQLNDFYSQKQFPCAEVNSTGSTNLESTLQQQILKNTAPFFSNNMSSFTFSKVPNIENLRVIQNPTSSNQKSYLNNVETYASIMGNDDQRKQHLENRKFNNIFTNQPEYSVFRYVLAILAELYYENETKSFMRFVSGKKFFIFSKILIYNSFPD